MHEAQCRTLVTLEWIRHSDGRLSGPYGQRWTDATSEDQFHVLPGAEIRVQISERFDLPVRVLTVDRERAYLSRSVVVPRITAEEINVGRLTAAAAKGLVPAGA